MRDIVLEAGDLLASISRRGAELRVLRQRQLDLLWNPDPAIWGGTCALLFPVIGRVRDDVIRVDGSSFPMPMHGFASDQDFSVAAADATTCTLELSDTAVTRRHYPYRFRLSVTFTLARDGVTITTRIANPGPRPLPASFGIHPGFAWPLLPGTDKSDYSLRFPSDQTLIYTRPVNRLIAPSRQTLRLIRGELPLTEDLFAEGGLLLLTPRSRSLSYGCAAGLRIVLEYPDFPQLLLWMRPGGSFICIEPCRGFADPVDFDDDFSRKPGLIMIGPGSAESFSFRIAVVAT